MPPWLWLLIGGMLFGAGSVVFVQERYLPKRLSADGSARLTSAFEQADAQRRQLETQLGDTTRQLEAARAEAKALADKLSTSQAAAERLRTDLAAVVASLPPDPRGGGVEVRSGRFTANAGTLSYDVVLTRQSAGKTPLTGVLQLVVAGESASGTATTINAKPVPLSIGTHEVMRGSLALPEGFRPRQTTVQVLDRVAGRSLGMRVLLVK